jgi:hypothetical protein
MEALAALGAVASLAQLADYGFQLGTKLYTYTAAVSKADSSIGSLSNEVSLTAAVLKELGILFETEEACYVSSQAVEATKQTVAECFKVFEQLDAILEKSFASSASTERGKGLLKLKTKEKPMLPFFQPKIDLLQSNLDRLKASLTLMLQVLSYARDFSERYVPVSHLFCVPLIVRYH